MAKDVVGDQAASRRGYERMRSDGYGDVTIPVWQAMPAWIGGLSVQANARSAARDPVLRGYVDRAPLVAIGGLNQSPVPGALRHLYLQTLCGAFPSARFWALGQFVGDVCWPSRSVRAASITDRRCGVGSKSSAGDP